MKTKELMIGDFVHYTKDQWLTDDDKAPLTITGVGVAEYPDYMPFYKIKGSNEKYHQDLFEPIPLTAEIFAKNKWYQGECGNKTLYFIPNKTFYLANSYKKGYMAIGVLIDGKMLNLFSVKYVHELQHFLHLVGLSGIADNLKIN